LAGAAADFGGPGRTVDHAVVMRELPQEDRLDRLVAAGLAGSPEIARIVAELCAFHERAAPAAPRFGSTRAIRRGFDHAFRLRPLVEREIGRGAALDRVREKVDGFLEGRAALFRDRVRRGRIRRCHGDLRMSNIFIDPGAVRIFDAVEFNPALASTDVAADVAYLAMDLRACGRADLADEFVRAYVACSGDERLAAVAGFYECYRALVRLLVESLVIADPTIGVLRKRRARRAARLYLALAGELAQRL
jgi:aminoglycoside phosphotransferase family enzyme